MSTADAESQPEPKAPGTTVESSAEPAAAAAAVAASAAGAGAAALDGAAAAEVAAAATLPPVSGPGEADRPEAAWRDVPLFPLGTVLFPGGALPLRIFEARYMDMVRECMKTGRPFGVCRIVTGRDTGAPAEHETVGCLARIIHWDMPQFGLLHLLAEGTRRFAVRSRRVEGNALIRADIDLIDDDPLAPVPADLSVCADLLRRLIAELDQSGGPGPGPVCKPYQFESAGWVANRLAEFLPIDPSAKQKLMVLDDPVMRLGLIRHILQDRGIVKD